ncbi:MAG: hypothetical protein IJP78_04205 [Clostridia bacterium]|nr:hypothetical protein [Clostridia bacterium]
MTRNVLAIVEDTKPLIPYQYEITLADFRVLLKLAEERSMVEAFAAAFTFGYAMALRVTKRDAKRKRQAHESKQGRS